MHVNLVPRRFLGTSTFKHFWSKKRETTFHCHWQQVLCEHLREGALSESLGPRPRRSGRSPRHTSALTYRSSDVAGRSGRSRGSLRSLQRCVRREVRTGRGGGRRRLPPHCPGRGPLPHATCRQRCAGRLAEHPPPPPRPKWSFVKTCPRLQATLTRMPTSPGSPGSPGSPCTQSSTWSEPGGQRPRHTGSPKPLGAPLFLELSTRHRCHAGGRCGTPGCHQGLHEQRR